MAIQMLTYDPPLAELSCDECGEAEELDGYTFEEAVEYAVENKWHRLYEDDQWLNFCPGDKCIQAHRNKSAGDFFA